MPLSATIAVPNRAESKRAQLEHWLEGRRAAVVDEECWNQMRTALAPVSDSYLRRMLRRAGVPLAPVVEGVAQESLETLERTLLALADEYGTKPVPARRAVLEAKEHARWSLRRASADRRAAKAEMLLWLSTWLENPALFAGWLAIRKRVLERAGADDSP